MDAVVYCNLWFFLSKWWKESLSTMKNISVMTATYDIQIEEHSTVLQMGQSTKLDGSVLRNTMCQCGGHACSPFFWFSWLVSSRQSDCSENILSRQKASLLDADGSLVWMCYSEITSLETFILSWLDRRCQSHPPTVCYDTNTWFECWRLSLHERLYTRLVTCFYSVNALVALTQMQTKSRKVKGHFSDL